MARIALVYLILAVGACSISGGGYSLNILRDSKLTLETNHQALADPNAP